ncbi:MAG: hypothetical protein ACI9UR_002843 [Bacteroidia bacterium]|jgi:hypothetical protein
MRAYKRAESVLAGRRFYASLRCGVTAIIPNAMFQQLSTSLVITRDRCYISRLKLETHENQLISISKSLCRFNLPDGSVNDFLGS